MWPCPLAPRTSQDPRRDRLEKVDGQLPHYGIRRPALAQKPNMQRHWKEIAQRCDQLFRQLFVESRRTAQAAGTLCVRRSRSAA